jgi:hypothetical protein
VNLFETLLNLEDHDGLHLGRLLVLLSAFAGKDATGSVEGLTKLAKLDFLLRYPANLERALQAKVGRGAEAKVEDYERTSIESSMVRYRFGPWDFRYRRFLNTLVAKDLVQVITEGRTIKIYLTPVGKIIADKLVSTPEFTSMSHRAKLLKRYCDLSATNLMKFIYETFPELVSMRAGARIPQ